MSLFRTPLPFRRGLAALVQLATLALLAPATAFAHHGMDGETPATLTQGLVSGLAHPVIGLDHLAFVLALAWLLSRQGVGRRFDSHFDRRWRADEVPTTRLVIIGQDLDEAALRTRLAALLPLRPA